MSSSSRLSSLGWWWWWWWSEWWWSEWWWSEWWWSEWCVSSTTRRRRQFVVGFGVVALVCLLFCVGVVKGVVSTVRTVTHQQHHRLLEDDVNDVNDETRKKGTRPSRGPKCVGFALGADVLLRPHQKEKSSSSGVKEALQRAIEFWATRAKCASVVLYFDIECERSARRYANEVMEIWAEGENRTTRSEKRSERRRRGRTVRVKLYSKETPPGKTEAIGEYFLDTGEDVVEEDWANGQNDGWVARWWRSSSVSLSSSSARLRRTTARTMTTAAAKKKTNDDDKPMDIIVLTSSTGYDILSGFTKSLKQRRRKMSRTNEEKETFLSSLLPSSKGSKSSSSEPPKPKTVALIEQELKVNFLENQLPTPELLVSVSQVFSVGKFPGFLLSKCELAHVESIERMTEDAVHRKILRDYLRSFQRFGS